MKTRISRGVEMGLAILLGGSFLLEACGVTSERQATDSRQDARMMLLAIQSLALGEEDAEEAWMGPGRTDALMRPAFQPMTGPIDEVKAAIRDLEAECARARVEIENVLPEADSPPVIAALEQACQEELAALQTSLQQLRARRDRSWWRRAWLGRRLASVWQRVKKTIRKDRALILLAIATGGGSLVKRYLVETGRAAFRAEGRTEVGRFLAGKVLDPVFLRRVNLSPGEWPPRERGSVGETAAGETEASGPEGALETVASMEDLFSVDSFVLPANGLWTARCTQRPCAGCEGEWTWTLSLNLQARGFESRAEYNRSETDQGGWLYTTHLVHEGRGEITEDGMLQGPFRETTSLTWTKAGVVGGPQVTEFKNSLYGVISADLRSICISRGEDPGNYDVDYIRRIGREAFFGPDAGCEAECVITGGP
jgi:hypothetical protein